MLLSFYFSNILDVNEREIKAGKDRQTERTIECRTKKDRQNEGVLNHATPIALQVTLYT